MRFLWLILAVALCPGAATADTQLFSGGDWEVDGFEDLALAPGAFGNITVSVNGTNVGNFIELKVFHIDNSNVLSQVFSVRGTGAIQPAVPPAGAFGPSAQLTAYWDCESNALVRMAITQLDIRLASRTSKRLRMKGSASNFDSFDAPNFALLFFAPRPRSVKVDVKYRLVAARDFCVSRTSTNHSDGLHVASLAANYVSGQIRNVDFARYLAITDRSCVPFLGCSVSRRTFCANILNEDALLYDKPRRLGSPSISLIHRDEQPTNTPSVSLFFRVPHAAAIRPQGQITASSAPDTDNVEFWGEWARAKREYKDGDRIHRVHFRIKAVPAGPKDCDFVSDAVPSVVN
jgi:hypothetical protein